MKKLLINGFSLALASVLITGCSSVNSEQLQVQNLIKVNAGYANKSKKRFDSIYEAERKKLLANTIKNPVMPVKTPDKILRVLTMPYVDENNVLQTENFQFVKVDDGRWIIGEYLNNDSSVSSHGRILTPLKEK